MLAKEMTVKSVAELRDSYLPGMCVTVNEEKHKVIGIYPHIVRTEDGVYQWKDVYIEEVLKKKWYLKTK